MLFLLANTGIPVLGRAPTPSSGSLRILFSGYMNSCGHGDEPPRSPSGADLSQPSAAKSHITQGHNPPRVAHTQWLTEEGCKGPTISAHLDNSDRPHATLSSHYLPNLASFLFSPLVLIPTKYPAHQTPLQCLLSENITCGMSSSWPPTAADLAQRTTRAQHDLLLPLLRSTSLLVTLETSLSVLNALPSSVLCPLEGDVSLS